LSNLNKKIYARIEAWRSLAIKGDNLPYVCLDGIVLKQTWSGEVRHVCWWRRLSTTKASVTSSESWIATTTSEQRLGTAVREIPSRTRAVGVFLDRQMRRLP
jgi:hypothetical protein